MARRPKPPPLPRAVRVERAAEKMRVSRDARKLVGAEREGWLDKAWKLDSAFNLGERLLGLVASWTIPSFVSTITVSCVGGPHADIRRVWYLTLAAAFGRHRNTPARGGKAKFVTYEMAGLWDITQKICQVEISSATSIVDKVLFEDSGLPLVPARIGVGALLDGVRVAGRIDAAASAEGFVKRGPEQLTVGDSWPDWLRRGTTEPAIVFATWAGAPCTPPGVGLTATVTAVPRNYRDIFREYPESGANGLFGAYPFTHVHPGGGGAPTATRVVLNRTGDFTLPDTNRVITTAEKENPRVQPPLPVLDGRGRSNLLGLVAQTLQNPCFLPTEPPCSPVPNGDPGVFLPGPPNQTALQIGTGMGRTFTPTDLLPGQTADGRPETVATPLPAPDFR